MAQRQRILATYEKGVSSAYLPTPVDHEPPFATLWEAAGKGTGAERRRPLHDAKGRGNMTREGSAHYRRTYRRPPRAS